MNRTIGFALTAACLTACSSSQSPITTAEYEAACHGPPLASVEAREQALSDGYEINSWFKCIDKRSYQQVQENKARWAAANTPEALAAAEAERKRRIAEDERQRAEREVAYQAELERREQILAQIQIVPADANTAAESELAELIGVGTELSGQLVRARAEAPFRDWADLVSRVPGFGAAQIAVYASSTGLTVNGESLLGAPPNREMAVMLYRRQQRW